MVAAAAAAVDGDSFASRIILWFYLYDKSEKKIITLIHLLTRTGIMLARNKPIDQALIYLREAIQ